jgi:mRNA-degrading endonuclease RelE of RelBE toxin-antitoxin system
MVYRVFIKKKVLRGLRRLPSEIENKVKTLVAILAAHGPTGPHAWQNYSKLSQDEYHCHLTYRYVACWRHEQGTITIEVYYAGSREDAPY